MLDEIKTKLEAIHTAVAAAQARADEVGTKTDCLDIAMITKAGTEASAALEQLQTLQQKQAAQEASLERLAALATQPGAAKAKDGGIDELEAKYADNFTRYLRRGVQVDAKQSDEMVERIVDKAMFGATEDMKSIAIKTLQSNSNPDGGYFVRPTVSSRMVQRIFETSPMRNLADIQTTTSDSLEIIVDDGESTCGWVGETEARTDTDTPQVHKVTIPVFEVYASPKATQRQLDDAGFNVEAWLSGKVTRDIGRKENTSFISGTGSNQPRGILTYSAWAVAGAYEFGKIEQVNSGVSGAFTADGLKNLQNSLKEDYQGGATFLIKRTAFGGIITLKDGQGRYLLNTESLKTGDTKILLGAPVALAHDMQDVAADALACAYGDFSTGYTIVDRMGFRVLRDPYTSKPFVKFYTTKRTGGAVTNFDAIKLQKLAA